MQELSRILKAYGVRIWSGLVAVQKHSAQDVICKRLAIVGVVVIVLLILIVPPLGLLACLLSVHAVATH